MYVDVLPDGVSVQSPYAWYTGLPEQGIISPRTGVTDVCGPSCGCWELKLGPLQEKDVYSTAEPSFQLNPHCGFCW